jgi:hypothetical protein
MPAQQNPAKTIEQVLDEFLDEDAAGVGPSRGPGRGDPRPQEPGGAGCGLAGSAFPMRCIPVPLMDSGVDFVVCDNPNASRTYPAIIKPDRGEIFFPRVETQS